MNIIEFLENNAKTIPHKTAFIQKNKTISYEELWQSGLFFGGELHKKNIKQGHSVLIFLPLGVDLYIAMIGAWSVGASVIFIDFSRGSKFVSESVKRLLPEIIVCDCVTSIIRYFYKEIRNIPVLNSKFIQLKQKITTNKIKPLTNYSQTDPHSSAILSFTSGTTGLPKVTVRTHDFLIQQYNALQDEFDFSPDHIDLGTLPVFTLANLAAGFTTLLPNKNYLSKINAKTLANQIEKHNVTRAICSPALMEKLRKESPLRKISHMYLGGGPVFPSLLEQIQNDTNLYIIYGSTEAEPIAKILWKDVTEEQKENMRNGAGIIVGHIYNKIECKIHTLSKKEQDHKQKPTLPMNTVKVGEIIVSGNTVLKGYLHGIGDIENKIPDGEKIWHRTGDAGYIDENGLLWLLGRCNQKIEDSFGICYPFQIECMVNMRFGIRGTALLKDNLRVFIVENSCAISDTTLLDALKHMYIAKIIRIPKIPMDKRHNAKVEIPKLLKIMKNR